MPGDPKRSYRDYSGPDADRIHDMFASIAHGYDRANTVLSAGVHHLWRRRAVSMSGARHGDAILDCATGTGDLAIAFKKVVGPEGRVIGSDFVAEMLDLARLKAKDIAFEQADVTNLPYETNSFDVASISFGIRNVNDPSKGIAELARVVRPGGRVIIVEFGQPRNRLFGAAYDLYRRRVLPAVGGMVTGKADAYAYLESSAGRFPCAEDFVQMMKESASFASVDFVPLTFGIAYIYKGIKA